MEKWVETRIDKLEPPDIEYGQKFIELKAYDISRAICSLIGAKNSHSYHVMQQSKQKMQLMQRVRECRYVRQTDLPR